MDNKNLVDYFISETNKKFDVLHNSINDMKNDIDIIKKFRWQIVSGSLVASVFITAIFQIITVFITPN
jgi:hypothetical protein